MSMPSGPQRVPDGDRASHRPPGPVEGGEDAVAGGLDQRALERCHERGHRPVVLVEQVAPAAVADPGGELGRADDVGEQHGGQHPVDLDGVHAGQELLDLGDDGVGVAEVEEVVVAGQLDESGARESGAAR